MEGGGRGGRRGDFCPFRWQHAADRKHNVCVQSMWSAPPPPSLCVALCTTHCTHTTEYINMFVTVYQINIHVFPHSKSLSLWTLRITCQVTSSMCPQYCYWYCILYRYIYHFRFIIYIRSPSPLIFIIYYYYYYYKKICPFIDILFIYMISSQILYPFISHRSTISTGS